MNTNRYLIFTTLWVAAVPGIAISTFILGIASFSPAFFVALPLFALCVYLLIRFSCFVRKLGTYTQDGHMPESFFIRALPFFLPLYYVLSLTIIAWLLNAIEREAASGLLIFGLPQYAIPNFLFVLSSGALLENFLYVPLFGSGIMCIVGTCFVFLIIQKKLKFRLFGLAILLGITAVLGTAAFYLQDMQLGNVLRNDPNTPFVQDERGRLPWGDETDLTEFHPFRENNKLVKIDSPTLIIESEHPKIHGALALFPVYAAAVEATYKNIDPKKFDNKSEWENFIQGGTSPAAFESLLSGNVDLIFMAMPSPEQFQKAETQGKTLKITPIGSEAFVFFVSKTNPIENLTIEQIRGIYSKRITKWSELGGKNESIGQKILAFQRPEGSGSQTAMLRLMGDTPLAKPVEEESQGMMGGIINRVADYRNYGNSIGYSFRYYVEGMFKHEGVKMLSANGVSPTVENIQNGKYPIVGEIVIVTAGSENPNVQKLTDWFLTEQGQSLLLKIGYVPITKTHTGFESGKHGKLALYSPQRGARK